MGALVSFQNVGVGGCRIKLLPKRVASSITLFLGMLSWQTVDSLFKLEIPSFTRGKSQLLQADVENSKQLSSVRIHVERVIGHMKKKYRIL